MKKKEWKKHLVPKQKNHKWFDEVLKYISPIIRGECLEFWEIFGEHIEKTTGMDFHKFYDELCKRDLDIKWNELIKSKMN